MRSLLLGLGFAALVSGGAWPQDGPTLASRPGSDFGTTRISDFPLAPVHVDGRLSEPVWKNAPALSSFSFPWSGREAPRTEVRAFADAERLFLGFEVEDTAVIAERSWEGESTVDREDRVEVFFAADVKLERYFCLEIDPLGRVHDYAARSYRKFDSAWTCVGLRAAAVIRPGGYTVEASIPLRTLSQALGRPVRAWENLRIGFFRAEFQRGSLGAADDNWMSWQRPATRQPDFHVPSAFGDWKIPGLAASDSQFRTRGVVLTPDDLSLKDWPERAAAAGLTTVALHHGVSPVEVAKFIASPFGAAFLGRCAELGLHVEYELHAMRELLPRALFATEPGLFRMNDRGERTADANLCVHSARALEIVATNAVRLARQLPPTSSRYFFWGDDGLPWCRCPDCRDFSESDQALLLENHVLRALRAFDPSAQLAHLAYANTVPPPQRVKPAPGVFLEWAPIRRRYDAPYAAQTGAEAPDSLVQLEANLAVFPAETAQALEYWLDVSRFSGWKKPAVLLPWRGDLMRADALSYRARGVRQITTFGVWIDAEYHARHGEPTALLEYGAILKAGASPQ